jgi:hypothetical protein
MLKKDAAAKFIERESESLLYPPERGKDSLYYFFNKRLKFYHFHFHSDELPVQDEMDETAYQSLLQKQEANPVIVAKNKRKTWWMFKGEFYWEDEGYTELEVKGLIALSLDQIKRKERKIQRAISRMEREESASSKGRELY